MSLYQYYRNTNPKLKEMENELIVLNNSYSTNTYTTLTLNQSLTEAGIGVSKNYFESFSIIDIVKKAGVKNYWLTNQAMMGA